MSRLSRFQSIILVCILIGSISCENKGYGNSGWDTVSEIQRRIIIPIFPDRDFNIIDYGAVNDGKIDCSSAIRKAIEECHKSGGGRVLIPPGRYLTGAIRLKSNVNLHLSKDAVLIFSTNPQDYLPVVYTRFEGVECLNYTPFIYAYEEKNIALTGTGILDGQADNKNWWSWAGKSEYGWTPALPYHKNDRDVLLQMAEDNVPVKERIFGEGHYLRPNFIQLYKSENILIDGVTIQRSPMWEIHPVLCENVTVKYVTVISHGPNNDGCNPESSRDVLIENCHFDTGDDCIAIKSGRNGDGRRINIPSENIIIRNCIMKDGHGGVVVGSEMSGNVHNIFVENCIMDSPNLERVLRIKTNSLRGGVVENVFMRNIEVGQVSDAILRINFLYEDGDAGPYVPVVRNVFLSGLTSRNSRYVLALDGYKRSPIQNINLTDCRFDGVLEGNVLNHVDGLKLENVFINGEIYK